MAKGETSDEVFERFWISGTKTTQKALAHLAIDLDITKEKLGGYLLADAIARAKQDIDAARKLLPRKPR